MRVSWIGTTSLSEIDTSPEIVLGERVSVTRTFHGPHLLCLSSAPGRGAFGTGIAQGLRVAESQIKHEKGGRGILIIRYEPLGQLQGPNPISPQQILPPDEYSIDGNDQELPLERHPRYAGATAGPDKMYPSIPTILEAFADTDQSWGIPFRIADRGIGLDSEDADDMDLARLITPRSLEFFRKIKSGFTHFLISPPTIHLTTYSLDFPAFNGGGFRQQPVAPIDLPAGWEFLRKSDKVSFNGSHWKLEKTWVGGPAPLDRDIY